MFPAALCIRSVRSVSSREGAKRRTHPAEGTASSGRARIFFLSYINQDRGPAPASRRTGIRLRYCRHLASANGREYVPSVCLK